MKCTVTGPASLPQFENVHILCALAEKYESWQQCHNFRARELNKEQKKISIRSEGWLRPAEFLEFVPRGELEESISLDQGTSTGDGRLMRARAVPGMGLVTPSAGGSETRPAGHDAGLPGAGCPGSGSVVRYHEARDRTEPRPRGFGESRGRAPEGERVSQKGGARRDEAHAGGNACRRERGNLPAPFGAPPPLHLFGRQSFRAVHQNSGANQKNRAARTRLLILTRE